jgi:hypothetical protein
MGLEQERMWMYILIQCLNVSKQCHSNTNLNISNYGRSLEQITLDSSLFAVYACVCLMRCYPITSARPSRVLLLLTVSSLLQVNTKLQLLSVWLLWVLNYYRYYSVSWPEGRGFESRWGGFFFQYTSSFQPQYCPGVGSASNRNEYQESSWGVKSGRRVRLTNLPPSVNRLSRANVGSSTSHNPMGLHGLLQG